MLSSELEVVLRRAMHIALEYKHEYVTYEHLLLALLEDAEVHQIFIKNNSNTKLINHKLKSYLKNNLMDLVNESTLSPKPTAGFQRIIQRALLHTRSQGGETISSVNILAEFFYEHDSYALLCLRESNISRKSLVDYNIGVTKINQNKKASTHNTNEALGLVAEKEPKSEKINIGDGQDPLDKYCVNLNEWAKNENIDCLIGRNSEIDRTIEILCRRKKNNVVLVGEPGVGKTAIAEGMAYRIVKKEVPDLLKTTVIYSLDLGGIIAGTKFRGEFEGRIKELVDALSKNKDAILFIDEIHAIIGAGSSATGAMDASNLLKPALTKGLFRCIGATTFKEYHNHFEQDMALVRRFQKVIVEEPNEEVALSILEGLKGKYEKHHNVKYDISALKAAVNLSQRYLNDRKLPDKAIDLMDEAGARSNIDNKSKKKITLTNKDIEKLLSNITNIPSIQIEEGELQKIKNLSANLKSNIFAQDEAIDILCSSIKMVKAGLRKSAKPMGCYMFSGPTGVGKTELARQLAHFNNMKLLKFDMSEFAESSSISKLLGSAPGYVGFERGGILTDEVNKYPYSVVLFDEIEKANPEIFNLLLQIMDDGKITDSSGKHINFTNTIVILTTNVISESKKQSIGFGSSVELKEESVDMSSFESYFSPEFRSRLDKIILFNTINDVADKIILKSLEELFSQLEEKRVFLDYSKDVIKYFNDNYFLNGSGARDLSKAIDVKIKQLIADEILFGKLIKGGKVFIDIDKTSKELQFKFKKIDHSSHKQLETS
ncbi:MAG: hypothetical protein DGJ47_000874 [Rickettsiaceae bacterium]